MTHPFKRQSAETRAAKANSMSKNNNLDIPIQRAVGENRAGGVHESKNISQNMGQNDSGMKCGGRAKRADGGRTGVKAITEGGEGDGPYPIASGSHSGQGRMQKAKAYAKATGIKPIKGGSGH